MTPDNRQPPDSAWIPGTAGISVAQLWAMLWARKWIAIGVAALISFATLGYLLTKEKQYDAFATLLVDYQSNDPTVFGGFAASLENSYLNTQAQLLTSRRIMADALQTLGWTDDPEARAAFAGLGADAGSYTDWLASKYLQETSVSTDPESRLMHVSFVHEDAVAAARLVNALVDAYMSSKAAIVQGPASERTARFQGQVSAARSQLEMAQAALTDYQQTEALIDLPDRVNAQQEALGDLTTRLVAARSRRAELADRVSLVNEMQRRGDSSRRLAQVLSQSGAAADSFVQTRGQLETLIGRRAELSRTLGPNHPRMQALGAEIAALQSQQRRAVNAAVTALERELQLAVATEETLEQRVEEQRATLLDLEARNDRLETLRNDLKLAQSRYEQAVRRFDDASVSSTGGAADVSVVRRAVPSSEATGASKLMLLIAGCLFGGIIGAGVAFTVELIWRRLRSVEDVEREWGLPVLGELSA